MRISRARTAARREQVHRLTLAGVSARDIAEQLNTTVRTVIRDRRALGIAKPPPQPLTETELRRAALLLEDGCSIRETARTIGRSQFAVAHHFPDAGWTQQQGAEHSTLIRRHVQLTRQLASTKGDPNV